MSLSVRKIIMFGESSGSEFLARSYDVTAMTSYKLNHFLANTEDVIIVAVQRLCNF
jgi:hypothetical protein